MTEVIEMVPEEIIRHRDVGRMCQTCGCGYSGEEHHYEAPCDNCDDTQMPYEAGWVQVIRGYPIVRCVGCRRRVECEDSITNTCPCGEEYNGSGQHLAPREQWGLDTGETIADIMSPYDAEELW